MGGRYIARSGRRGSSAGGDRKSTRLNSSHTVIYTLSLHDALPIFSGDFRVCLRLSHIYRLPYGRQVHRTIGPAWIERGRRSEEHTSELQSHRDLHSFPTRRSSDLLRRLPRVPEAVAYIPAAVWAAGTSHDRAGVDRARA